MIDNDDLNKYQCFVCEKKLNINVGKDMDNFVYLHFTTKETTTLQKFLYFCPACWRNTAGDDYCLEGFEE